MMRQLCKNDEEPLRIKYGLSHIYFFMEALSDSPTTRQLDFTFLIQVLNHLLRQASNIKIQAPNKLMGCLR